MGTGSFLRQEFLYEPTPIHVCSIGRYNGLPWTVADLGTGGVGTTGWPANNLAIYIPISIPIPFVVARFMVANGSNITGNVDVGIYSAAGTLLLSTGTTARANASAVQYIGVTDTVFQAGHYYLALVASSTTGTFLRVSFSSATRAIFGGPLQEALGSTVLPATMTPASYAQTDVFQFGFTQSDSL